MIRMAIPGYCDAALIIVVSLRARASFLFVAAIDADNWQ